MNISKSNIVNIVLSILLIVSVSFTFVFLSDLQKAKGTIEKYENAESLQNRSEEFVKAFAEGDYKSYLTGEALARYEQAEKTDHDHKEQQGEINEVTIKQLFTKTTDENKEEADSYSVIEMRYETGDSGTYADDYFQTISLNTAWELTSDNKWKVNKMDVSLLEDQNDDALRKQAEEALEKEEDNE